MAVDNKNSEFLGKMVKVKIVDSCGECERSHIDLSETAFNDIRKQGDGIFPVIWVAATTEGKVIRDIVYPSSKTEDFAKKYFGLSKSEFISMYKKQALNMITKGITHASFDKHEAPATTTKKTTTTTTHKTTTTVSKPTSAAETKVTPAPEVEEKKEEKVEEKVEEKTQEKTEEALGGIKVVIGETDDKSVPDDAPIVGKTKTVDPNKTDYTEEDIKVLESQFPDEENDGSNIGVISGVLTVSGAAGIGLLVLKKKSPGKYDELKQKFPETFGNIKRSVTRTTSQLKRSVTRSANSLRGKNKKGESRHGDHSDVNYREMPEHMFGSDSLPRIELYDSPVEPENTHFPEDRIII